MVAVKHFAPRESAFVIHADGSVGGDDLFGGELAQAIRYAGRILAQLSDLLGVGEIRGLSVLGPTQLAITFSFDAYQDIVQNVEIRVRPRPPVEPASTGRPSTSDELRYALDMLRDVDGVVGAVLVSPDGRVVCSNAPAGLTIEGLAGGVRRVVAAQEALARHVHVGDLHLRFGLGAIFATPVANGTCLVLLEPGSDAGMVSQAARVAASVLTGADLGAHATVDSVASQPPAPPASPAPAAPEPPATARPARRLDVWGSS